MLDYGVEEAVYYFTDSSDSGFGGHTETDYFWGLWKGAEVVCPHAVNPPTTEDYDSHINVTELWPVVRGLHRWCHEWRDKIVWVVTDNTQVQACVNTGRSINSYSMCWLREIFWVTSFFNIHLRAARISSGDNFIADALSRLDNPDCVDVCRDIIKDFDTCCCRAGRLTSGMGGPAINVLVGCDNESKEVPMESVHQVLRQSRPQLPSCGSGDHLPVHRPLDQEGQLCDNHELCVRHHHDA